MTNIEQELKKLNISLSINAFFQCGFIIVDELNKETISFLKQEISNNATFISNCDDLKTLNEILKTRIKKGEKLILYNLEIMYNLFGTNDPNKDGIYNFYQRITECYRDYLWENNDGQIYFILTKKEYKQFFNPNDVVEKIDYLDKVVEKRYPRDNHFRTMLTITIDLTNKNKHKKKIKN